MTFYRNLTTFVEFDVNNKFESGVRLSLSDMIRNSLWGSGSFITKNVFLIAKSFLFCENLRYNHFEDILTKEEEEEVHREQKIKEEAFSKLRAREEELVQIKESQIKARRTEEMERKKKKKKEVKINSEAFINYFKMYYDKDRPQVCGFFILIMSF